MIVQQSERWGSPKAVVSIKPDTHVFTGERVTLRCDVQRGGSTQWTYSWYKNNNRLTDSTMQEFIIRFVTDSDSGDYTCRGQSSDSQRSEISNAVTVTVSVKSSSDRKPTVRVNPQSSVYTGDTITLSCELQQSTGWEFFWYKNFQLLPLLNSEQAHTLNLTVDNTGETVYQCLARRRNYDYYTMLSDSVRITVRARPKPVASINPDKQVFSGDAVTLRCDIQDESVSSWQYSWYKDASHSPVSSEQVYRISGVEVTHTGNYTCRAAERGGSHSSHFSDAVTLTVSAKPKPTVRVNPQSSVYTGDTITLSCELQQSTGWEFLWYKNYQQLQLLNSEQAHTLNVTVNNSGETVYQCRARRNYDYYTEFGDPVRIAARGESPPVSLIINPSRTQHFSNDSLSLSCEDQSNSTGWTVRRYKHNKRVLDCSRWGSVTGSTCKISFLSTTRTGVYWCESESGENSNPVNITVHDGDLILESPVHPVTEGHPLTLRCLYRNTNSSNLRADFYKDGAVLQTQTTGEMILYNVSKSDEGFYHCKHPERGKSLKSWLSVRLSGSRSGGGTVGVAVGLGFLFIALLILMILLWSYKRKKAHCDGGPTARARKTSNAPRATDGVLLKSQRPFSTAFVLDSRSARGCGAERPNSARLAANEWRGSSSPSRRRRGAIKGARGHSSWVEIHT
ncbi:B-cell receptor CD22-like [Pangasianodon hypophthalmus]|uniref:B-cell receptor CD22-like n=1 Tax=Pangasianodon hypophthalmus TaxID=310915 RepID=UPI00230740EE|nr:B-cell receptor CD22-like [Pangasianodon hypophthalmus]